MAGPVGELATPPPVITLCFDADLMLVVGEDHGQAHRYKVSRHTLCMASPVFKAMLTGNFSEAVKDEIVLEDDDPGALLLVLRIAHLKHSEVRRTLSLPDLVNVATICDKYDTAAVCRPFVAGWIDQWLPTSISKDSFEVIWPTWVFGYDKQFVSLVDELYQCFTLNDLGHAEYSGQRLADMMMPPGLLENLEKGRLVAIDSILTDFYFFVDSYVKGSRSCQEQRAGTREAEACSAFLVGQLIRASYMLDCFPVRQMGTDRDDSIDQLYSKLTGISLNPYTENNSTHNSCALVSKKMATRMYFTLKAIPSPILDYHRVHLREQWKKGNLDPAFT
ncbi:V-type proton ATPase subunit D [Venturia nashicola]|uniref:V-type proton ATPase subunit D n=1 Tax=Venturia nashicola TaxID=86259 RepID=A0A4Z1PHL3_9PEZI|nr:V-type proton ATPase subunit D [Venturia nashicola]